MLRLLFLVAALLALGGLRTTAGPGAPPPTPCAGSEACPTPTPAPTPCSGTAGCPTPTPRPTPCLNSGACPTPTAIRAAPGAGTVEYQFIDDGPPHAALVFTDGPWFGWAGAPVALSWHAGDPEAVIYLPPPACQWTPPGLLPTDCGSVCPAALPCFVGVSTYRRTSAEVRALVLPPVPFYPGAAGDPVRLTLPGDGTARWVLP